MEEKIEEMEFKRGSVKFYGGPNEGANTFTSTARGGFTIFTLGNTAREKSQRGMQRQAFLPRIHVLTKLLTAYQGEDDAVSVILGRLSRVITSRYYLTISLSNRLTYI